MTENTPAKLPETPLAVFEERRRVLDLEAATTNAGSLMDWVQGKLGAILTADSFEAINGLMTQTGLTPAKALIGRTFEILDLALRESAEQYREQSQLKKYALVKAVDVSTGEEFVIDGGGDQVIAGIVRMRDLYGFPFTGTLLALATGTGNEMQYWRFHDPKRAKIQ